VSNLSTLFIRAALLAQHAVETVHSWLAPLTPASWLAAVLGLGALVLMCRVGTLVAQLVHRRMEQRNRAAERDGCTYVLADGARVSTGTAEYEALWR
jgi:hypothetical protein